MLEKIKKLMKKEGIHHSLEPVKWYTSMERGFECVYVIVRNISTGREITGVILNPNSEEETLTGLEPYID